MSNEKRAFDHSYRRTGKTTRLCTEIAAALKADPELRVYLTGPYVTRNKWHYQRLLHEMGADLDRVRFVPPDQLGRRTAGVRGKLFCDDFVDLELEAAEAVIRAERYLR